MLKKVKEMMNKDVQITITYTEREKKSVFQFLGSVVRSLVSGSLVIDSYKLMKDAEKVSESRQTMNELSNVENIVDMDSEIGKITKVEKTVASSVNYEAEKNLSESASNYADSKVLHDVTRKKENK